MISVEGSISLTQDGNRKLSISIHLQEREKALLIGRNGVGKTTILDVVAGARWLDEGSVTIPESQCPIGYAVQEPGAGLLPWRSILGNILLPARLRSANDGEIRQRAIALLDMFGLAARAGDYPYILSGGEKQIVNLIRVLCTPCSLVLLDEVLTSLHQDARAKATKLLSEFLRDKTALVVTHDVAEFNLPYDRCFLIEEGSVDEIERQQAKGALGNAV